jgi:hypothetical protein
MERTSATARRLSFQACAFTTYVPFITTMFPPPRIPMCRSPTLPGKENSDGPAAFHPNLRSGHGSGTSPDVFGEFFAYADRSRRENLSAGKVLYAGPRPKMAREACSRPSLRPEVGPIADFSNPGKSHDDGER